MELNDYDLKKQISSITNNDSEMTPCQADNSKNL